MILIHSLSIANELFSLPDGYLMFRLVEIFHGGADDLLK